MAVNDRRPPAA